MNNAEQIAGLLQTMHQSWEARQAATESGKPFDRPATEEEARDKARLLAQMEAEARRLEREGQPLQPLAEKLIAEQTRVQELQAAREKLAAAIAPPAVQCPACRDTGYIRRQLPDKHPDFGRAQPCPKCGHEAMRGRVEAAWPVPTKVLALADEPLHELHPELGNLIELVMDILTVWPKGILACIDGAYGTAKSHALGILYVNAWLSNRPAIYVPSAMELQKLFTDFDKTEKQLKGSPEDLSKVRLDRTQAWDHLVRVPWLLVDEAHRYTRKDGGGWVEMHMADLIDQRLARGNSTVLAGNGMGKSGPNSLHPSVLDRASAPDCPWIDLTDLPSGRPFYSRNAPGWREEARAKRHGAQ